MNKQANKSYEKTARTGSFSRQNRSFGSANGRFFRGRTPRRSRGEYIDVSRFVNKASVVSETAYIPTHTFADFPLDESLQQAIITRGYQYPSAIQDQAIGPALQGSDILGIANTGTGKTAAFLIPIINALLQNEQAGALVLAPTRELALQIQKEFDAFAEKMNLYSVACVGGAPVVPQIREIRRGVHMVIGTPGRVMDLIRRGVLDISYAQYVVLDEADRMLDMGFVDDITEVLQMVPSSAQKLFFSATLAPKIETLARTFLNTPVTITVKTRDTSKNVDQDVIRVPAGVQKIDHLHQILSDEALKKVLIFAERKVTVEELTQTLQSRGFQADSIHGDKQQRDRSRILEKFRSDVVRILIATDVAARGLDIPDVTHVINYEIPQSYDTYVHRIGRTGRANKQGVALTFVG